MVGSIRFGGHDENGANYVPAISKAPGRLVLVAGPSGVGKGTVIAGVFDDPSVRERVEKVSSITTRKPRPGETLNLKQTVLQYATCAVQTLGRLFSKLIDPANKDPILVRPAKKQYEFIPEATFLNLKQRNQIFQWAHYDGNWYGSTVQEVVKKLNKGITVLFELASRDALKMKSLYPDKITTVFIAPPRTEDAAEPAANDLQQELKTLKDRLTNRGTNSDASIAERLRKAEGELALKPQFDQIIVNENNQQDKAIAHLRKILLGNAPQPKFSGIVKPTNTFQGRQPLPTSRRPQSVCREGVLYV
jgi:guanylate kinase